MYLAHMTNNSETRYNIFFISTESDAIFLCTYTCLSALAPGATRVEKMSVAQTRPQVNPDLIWERNSATFNPEQLTYLLDGNEHITHMRRDKGTMPSGQINLFNRIYMR